MGGKQRIVLLNSKVLRAIKDYLIDRKTYSTAHITPHELRHFFCMNAIEKGFSIREVANQAIPQIEDTAL